MNTATAPSSDIDFYGEETLKDPASAYREFLSLGPVVWLTKQNVHAICGFQALTTSLRNQAVFASGKGVSMDEDVNKFLTGSTLNSDPPEHDKTRAITFSPLSPKALEATRDRIEREATALAETVVAQGEFDAASELAPHLPMTIVRDLVGLGDHGKDHMLTWGAATFELMGDAKERKPEAVANLGRLRIFLESPDTLSQLNADGWAKAAWEKGLAGGMEDHSAATLMRDYIAPSLDTTISAIGYAIMLFAKHPDQWDIIRADRSKIKNAIEEIVRLNTPIRAFSRYVMQDIEVEGVTLKADTRALMIFGAANRDSSRFPDPDRFDIERNARGHVGFGHGVHACLGMHLARLEITSLLNALADRVTRFHLTGPVQTGVNATIHSLQSVPVRVEIA